MKDTEYIYASAYVRTLENRMLRAADFETLIGSSSLDEALRYLTGKGYGVNADDLDALFQDEMSLAYREVSDACPKDAPIQFPLIQNDFHNLKTIIKALSGGTGHAHLMLGPNTTDPDLMKSAIVAGDFDSLPAMFQEPALKAYGMMVRDNDGQLAELLLDRALMCVFRQIADHSGNSFLAGWVDLNICIMNMKTALRGLATGRSRVLLREAMLECRLISADDLADASVQDVQSLERVFMRSGFTQIAKAARESIGTFEKWCDNECIQYLRRARRLTFGFEPVFGYLLGRQYELRGVRMILYGLRSGVSPQHLRERMRDSYA